MKAIRDYNNAKLTTDEKEIFEHHIRDNFGHIYDVDSLQSSRYDKLRLCLSDAARSIKIEPTSAIEEKAI